jgi:hypothetical protein
MSEFKDMRTVGLPGSLGTSEIAIAQGEITIA